MEPITSCFGHWLSAQATSDPTWQSDMAKWRPIEKVVDKIQPGPIWCFTWAEPNNSAFLIFIFSVSYTGQAHFNLLFISGPGSFKIIRAIIFWGWSHLSSSHTFGPLDKKFKIAQIILISGSHKSGFHSTHFQITYIINISNGTVQM